MISGKARVYVLLEAAEGKSQQLVQAVRTMPGVVMADLLDEPPGVIMVVEATNRPELARLTIRALASLENITEGVRLVPNRDTHIARVMRT